MATETGDGLGGTFRKKVGLAAFVAATSAVVGLLSALATLYSQIEPVVAAAIKRDFAPVGTVVASILEPKDFAVAVGEREGGCLYEAEVDFGGWSGGNGYGLCSCDGKQAST
jgi:hypothetical protein